MTRRFPLFVVLLCLLASAVFAPVAGNPGPVVGPADGSAAVPTAGHGADSPPPTLTNGSVARMELSPLARTNRTTVQPDLTTTLSTSTDAIAERIETGTIQESFDGLSTTSARQDLIIRALITMDDRSLSLVDRHRTAIRAYSNGSIGGQELLRQLAVIDDRTRQLNDRLDRLNFLIQRADAEYLFSRITTIRNRLRGIQNGLQQQLSAALAAGGQLPPIHIETGDDAIVIAAIIDGEYVRASYFHNNRNTSGPFELDSQGEAVERAQEYYPWAWDADHSFSTGGDQYGDLFIARSNHNHGRLTAYLDMHSGDVYKEVHELQLSEIPTSPGPSATGNGFRVVLNRTYAGGPMAVEVYDRSTGERVDARVSLNDGPFRQTNDDGVRWIVEPRLPTDEATYTVRVVVDSQSITLTVAGSKQSIGDRHP